MLSRCYKACSKEDIRLISVDMFDTLVFREAGEPKALFYELGKRAYQKELISDDLDAFVALRCAAEREARILAIEQKGIGEVTLAEIYDQISYLDSRVWCRLEIETELEGWRVNEALCDMLVKLQSDGKRLVLLSDMYLPEETIRGFWDKAAPQIHWQDIHVSGTRETSKLDGSAYEALVKASGLPRESMIHIGDNLVTDVQMAEAAGVQGFHLKQPEYLKEIGKLEKGICPKNVMGLQRVRQVTALQQEEYQDVSYQALGAFVYGPVLTAFASWIIDVCQKQGIERLYCLLREGEIIAEVLRAFKPSMDVRTIAISRRSSLLPLKGEVTQDTLFKLTERRGYSLEELAEDVGQNLTGKLTSYADEYLSELVNKEIWTTIANWVEEKREEISRHLKNQKEMLEQYLKEKGIENTKKQALLDWGCGGSMLIAISDLLCLNKNQFFMFYRKPAADDLALKGVLHCFQPQKVSKQAGAIATSPELSEILLNQNLHTTVAYKEAAEGVEPVLSTAPTRNEQELKEFKKGVLACVKTAKAQNWPDANPVYPNESKFRLPLVKAAGGMSSLNGQHVLKKSPRPTLKKGEKNERSYWADRELDTESRRRLFTILYRLNEYPLYGEAKLLSDLQVPISSGRSVSLLQKENWKSLKERSADACWQEYLKHIDTRVKNTWWYPGMMALAHPGYLQQQGDFFRQFDDDFAAAMLLEKVKKRGIKKVVVYGAGELGYKLYALLEKAGIEIEIFIDRRAKEYQFKLAGLPVYSLDQAKIEKQTNIVIASRAYSDDIYQNLALRFPQHVKKIIRVE